MHVSVCAFNSRQFTDQTEKSRGSAFVPLPGKPFLCSPIGKGRHFIRLGKHSGPPAASQSHIHAHVRMLCEVWWKNRPAMKEKKEKFTQQEINQYAPKGDGRRKALCAKAGRNILFHAHCPLTSYFPCAHTHRRYNSKR